MNVQFSTLLIVGLIGNFLVVFVVIRNEAMRTPTNIFLVNLALADFLVLLFCLPTTVATEVTHTWWFGITGCRLVSFLQVSIFANKSKTSPLLQFCAVAVSVLTMVAISIERWYAIVFLFGPRISTAWTLRVLSLIWIVGFVLAVPEAVANRAQVRNYTDYYPDPSLETAVGCVLARNAPVSTCSGVRNAYKCYSMTASTGQYRQFSSLLFRSVLSLSCTG